MDESDVIALNDTLKAGGFKDGLNLGRVGQIFGENLNDFNLEKVLTNIKNKNKDLFNHLRRDTKSMEQLLEAAGFEDITYKFLSRKLRSGITAGGYACRFSRLNSAW